MQKQQFTIKHNIGTNHIFSLLSEKYSNNQKSHATIQREYLDSFDWRLFQNSYICGMDKHLDESVFFMSDLAKDENLCEIQRQTAPKFPADIKHASCYDMLDDILGIRALVPVTNLSIKQQQLLVLDNEEKTLVKIQVESYTTTNQNDTKQIPGRLIIFPLRGYKKAFQKVSQFVIEQLKLPEATRPLFEDVLGESDIATRIETLKPKKRLNDSLNTWDAAKILLNDLLKTMQVNEHGMREAIDTEFLHDYRVAVRRTRSALSQIKHLFSEDELEHFKREFYWLGSITSPTRDLDVYLLKFDNYIKELTDRLHDDLKPFHQFLHRHWMTEHDSLCKALDSERYITLINDWQQVLNRNAIESPQAVNAAKPAKEVANRRIWKLYKKVMREGEAISPESPDDDLHELRKTCKKFRYLMEFFQDYYPKKEIKQLIKTLKQLQDNLGDFQDLCIQTEQLNKFAQQMRDEGLANTNTIMAMGVLVQKLVTQQEAIRSHFEERFEEFSSPEVVIEFRNTFSPKKQMAGIPA